MLLAGPKYPQNKYTFHRSLAVAFALATWEAIVAAIFVFSAKQVLVGFTFLGLGSAAALFVLISMHQFENNWRFWGDAVIAETTVAQALG